MESRIQLAWETFMSQMEIVLVRVAVILVSETEIHAMHPKISVASHHSALVLRASLAKALVSETH